jgi:hypothetical protein
MKIKTVRLMLVALFMLGLCAGSACAASNPCPVPPLPPAAAHTMR